MRSRLAKVKQYCREKNISLGKYLLQYAWDHVENVRQKLQDKFRRVTVDRRNRKRLQNRDISVLSINCNGGTICHDLGLRFNSQFVNLWMYPSDYLEYLQRFDHYNALPLEFISQEGVDYPVGSVGGLKLFFMHYLSEDEAKEKWETRKKRLNPDNIFVLMTDQEGCTHQQMQAFDQLPFSNKVIFTHIPQPDIESSFYISGFENCNMVGKLNGYVSKFSPRKHYDQFDYVSWFNGEPLSQIKTRKRADCVR